MTDFPSTPAAIAQQMTGTLTNGAAILPSPAVQNHAAFLCRDPNGQLQCFWFGGTLEGKSDICVYMSTLENNQWSPAQQLTHDPLHSEQNPILFHAPDGRAILFHTAQRGGDQDGCVVRMRVLGDTPVDLPLPRGTFVRAAPYLRDDGAWLLPLFHCTPKAGARWTGRHDSASVAIAQDNGQTWRIVPVPDSIGCVHMTIVKGTKDDTLIAFFRRRQADFVYRTTSHDGGESWSTPTPTPLPNNNASIAVLRMSDGRLALCCNPTNKDMSSDRRISLYDELGDDARPEADGGCIPIWGVPRAPLVVAFSDDDGISFPNQITVHTSQGTCLSNNSVDGKNLELSYPSLCETLDGGLDVAFTLHRRAIAHKRLSANEIGAVT